MSQCEYWWLQTCIEATISQNMFLHLQPYLPFKYSPQQKLNKLEPDNSSYQLRNMNYAQWAKFHP